MNNEYVMVNGHLEFSLTRNDDTLSAKLRLQNGGYSSYDIPLAVLEIGDRMQDRVDRVEKYKVMQIEGGGTELHLTLRSVAHGITVGLWLTLHETGELSIVIPPAEIEEQNGGLYKLYAVNVLPGLMRVESTGKILLPVNTGILTSPAGKSKLQDRFLIYGEQERWELLPTLPVCAVKTPQGGLTAIAVSGAHDMYCDVSTDGMGNGTVGLYPMFRRNWIDPLDWTEREIRVSALAPDDDVVVKSAKLLRRHIVEDLGKKTLSQRAEESPECAYQQRAYTMKIFHGIQQQGIMMFGRENKWDQLLFQRCLTFADAQNCFKRLKKAGIERILFQSVGWNPKGHDGAYPTDFPIDRRLGGEGGFRDMIIEAKRLGFNITAHENLGDAYFSSPDFHSDWVITDIWGEPKVTGFWGGGIKSTHWGLAVPEGFIRSRLDNLKRMGFNGMQYLDGMGNPLYMNYHPVNGGTRADHAAGTNRFLNMAQATFGAVQTEMGFLYCALHADALCTGGAQWHTKLCNPTWPITSLMGEPVPLWQLALHGLVTLENTSLDWPGTMRALLFAEVPRDEWSMEGTAMPILTDARIDKLKAKYDLCCERFGHLITQELLEWKKLADKVETTRFEDGTEIKADFAAQRLWVDNREIICPLALQGQRNPLH